MKKFALILIKIYQKYLSLDKGLLGKAFGSPKICIYEYTYTAIEKYGIFKGSFYGIFRILRCNPFAKGGYDPVK